VLHAGAAVEVDVLLDLRLALALGGLVDRELDPARAVGHDLRHQRGVLGRDLLVGEVDHLGHPEDALVVVDPLLHVAELDVADHVVDAHEQQLVRVVRRHLGAPLEARQERALVAVALDEQVQRVAVGGDRREPDLAVLVLDDVRRMHAARPVLDRVVVGGLGVGHAQRDLVHAVAVVGVVARDLVVTAECAGQDQPDAALLQNVRDAVAAACLEPRVGGLGEAERVAVVVGGLRRVADVELEVVDAVDRHAVDRGRWRRRRQLFDRHPL
jgi:hypothetical protein